MHARTHARTHAHTPTHTHTPYKRTYTRAGARTHTNKNKKFKKIRVSIYSDFTWFQICACANILTKVVKVDTKSSRKRDCKYLCPFITYNYILLVNLLYYLIYIRYSLWWRYRGMVVFDSRTAHLFRMPRATTVLSRVSGSGFGCCGSGEKMPGTAK